jgi:hypothetical protein
VSSDQLIHVCASSGHREEKGGEREMESKIRDARGGEMGFGLTDEGGFAVVVLAGIIHVLVRVPVRGREAGGVENYDGF